MIDIPWQNIGVAACLLLIPIFILGYYKTGQLRTMAWSFLRMTVQLSLVGFYLEYIFDLDSIIINLAWVGLMIIAASFTITKRSDINIKKFYFPVMAGIATNVFINGLVFAYLVFDDKDFFAARYIIPIMGMVIGNTLSSSIVAIRSYFSSLKKERQKFRYYLMLGASREEALFKFSSEALKNAFSPVLASVASMGLIWLPGMMTGQILGGSNPLTAIKYQFLIMIAIFTGSVVTVTVSIKLAQKSK